jgi:O-antigen/teichoic acid export membrane protein
VTGGLAGAEARRYGKTAGLLSVAVGAAGALTYLYFAFASHNLDRDDYGELVVLWAAVFITVSTLCRPVEQLLSRSLAEREAQLQPIGHVVRVAATIQLGLAALFAFAALALRGPLEEELLDGNTTLYWILIGAVVAYAAGYFGRGFFAGTRRFGLYAALLLVEGLGRVLFALAVAVGVTSGQSALAIAIVASPCLSLVVVPLVLTRLGRPRAPAAGGAIRTSLAAEPELTLAHGGGFAAAVLVIMFSEQVFMNGGVLVVNASVGSAAAGFIFNVLMVARAPVVLFQAVATSLLPHLTRLRSSGRETGEEAFRLSVRMTILLIVAFAGLAALILAAAGPELMQLAFGEKFEYDRPGLVIMAVGMGLYLTAATLNQAALAHGQVRRAAGCFLLCAVAFMAWSVLPWIEEFRRIETGFAGAAALLCGLLYLLYRRPRPREEDVLAPDSPQELEARLAAADEAA